MIKAPVSDSGQPLAKSGAAAPSADEPNSQRAEPQATAPVQELCQVATRYGKPLMNANYDTNKLTNKGTSIDRMHRIKFRILFILFIHVN